MRCGSCGEMYRRRGWSCRVEGRSPSDCLHLAWTSIRLAAICYRQRHSVLSHCFSKALPDFVVESPFWCSWPLTPATSSHCENSTTWRADNHGHKFRVSTYSIASQRMSQCSFRPGMIGRPMLCRGCGKATTRASSTGQSTVTMSKLRPFKSVEMPRTALRPIISPHGTRWRSYFPNGQPRPTARVRDSLGLHWFPMQLMGEALQL